MSGGSYNYAFRKLEDFADNLREHGACHCAPAHVRQAFSAHCRKVARAMEACEWNDSQDGHPKEEELIMEVLQSTELAEAVHDRLRRAMSECEAMSAVARELIPPRLAKADKR